MTEDFGINGVSFLNDLGGHLEMSYNVKIIFIIQEEFSLIMNMALSMLANV